VTFNSGEYFIYMYTLLVSPLALSVWNSSTREKHLWLYRIKKSEYESVSYVHKTGT
jgi:hypothetical protein